MIATIIYIAVLTALTVVAVRSAESKEFDCKDHSFWKEADRIQEIRAEIYSVMDKTHQEVLDEEVHRAKLEASIKQNRPYPTLG